MFLLQLVKTLQKYGYACFANIDSGKASIAKSDKGTSSSEPLSSVEMRLLVGKEIGLGEGIVSHKTRPLGFSHRNLPKRNLTRKLALRPCLLTYEG